VAEVVLMVALEEGEETLALSVWSAYFSGLHAQASMAL
jgi:hypothetical protein